MSTIKILLRTSKINEAGEAPLCIRITKDRITKFIFLDYRIRPEFWDEKERHVKKSHPNSARLNNYLTTKLMEAQGAALKMESAEKNVLPDKIKDQIMGKSSASFYKYAERWLVELDNTERIGTYRHAKSIIDKMKKYTGVNDLLFDHITVTWLKGYEQYLRAKIGNKINTVNGDFRTIRKLIRAAVSEEIITEDKNPFNRFKLTLEKVKRDYLTEEELMLMELAPLEKGSNKDHHRNMFIFSAYAGGLRVSDILLLKWKDYDGERILMQTRKTSTVVSIKLPPTAKEILKAYQTDNVKPLDFVFPFLKNEDDYTDKKKLYNKISSATAYTNDDLKDITKIIGLEKRVSFHTARHTFATRALQKGMRIEYVSKIMGHSNIQTTQIYAKIITSELDKAMEVFN